MNAVDAIVIVLLLVVVGGLAVLIVPQQRSMRAVRSAERANSGVELLDTHYTEDGRVAIELRSEGEPLLELTPLKSMSIETLSGRRPVKFDIWAPTGPGAVLASLLSYLPKTEQHMAWVVKFRPEIDAKLQAIQAELVRSKEGGMAIARGEKGRFIGQARIVQEQLSTLTQPQLAAALVVVGLVLHKLDEISEAVARIEEQLDEVMQRLRDDDHGELESAEALVTVLMPALTRGIIPTQLALELATARQRVDAIYFARQRFVERFRLRIVELQEREEERKGDDARAWARGTTREFSNREALREEALIYARAMVDRAQLAFCTAGVIALQDGGSVAISVLRHAEEELKSSFFELNELLQELAEERPKWAWVPFNDRKEVHDSARGLATLFADEVGPLLPRPSGRTLEFTATRFAITSAASPVELDSSVQSSNGG